MTATVNKNLALPTTGSESGTWGDNLNNNMITPLDLMLGGKASIPLSSSNYTIGTNSASEIQDVYISLTGSLLANVTVSSSNIGFYYVENNCSGAFTVSWVANFGSGSVGSTFIIPQNTRVLILSDATGGAKVIGYMPITTSADTLLYATGLYTFSSTSFPAYGRTLVGSSSASAANEALAVTQSITASGASLSIDLSLGWVINLTLSANVTSIAFTNPPASGKFLRVPFNISSTGSFSMTGWPGTTIWSGGNPPTITSGSGKKDTILLTSSDGGSNFRGYVVGQNEG
jgi:hypothetical protein